VKESNEWYKVSADYHQKHKDLERMVNIFGVLPSEIRMDKKYGTKESLFTIRMQDYSIEWYKIESDYH